jgi:hypothetical protein
VVCILGATQGGSCIRIALESQAFSQPQSFANINLLLPLKQLGGDRRRRSTATFLPADSSVIMVQYNGNTSDPELRSKLGKPNLRLADTLPPVFTGCPLTAVVATAVAADGFSTSASWSEPQATDNVGVSQTLASHNPGDVFSVDGSPHLVTYTAIDYAGLRSICQFDVVVGYTPSIWTVRATLNETFEMESVSKPLVPSAFEQYSLIDPSLRSLSFVGVDLNNFTGLDFAVASVSEDPVELRALFGVTSFQVAFDLKWNTELTLPQDGDSRVDVTLSFDDYVLTPGQGSGCTALASEHAVAGAIAAIDTVNGKMSVTGKSAAFSCGFTFSAVHIKVDFPYAETFQVASSLFWEADASSRLYVEVARSRASISSGPQLAAVIMQDTRAPAIGNAPRNATVGTGSTVVGTTSWPIPTVVDNRESKLELFASVGDSTPVLVPSGVATLSLGPIEVVFQQTGGNQRVTVPVQLPSLPSLQLRYVASDLYGNKQVHVFEVVVEDDFDPSLGLVGSKLVVNLTIGEARAVVAREDLIAFMLDNTRFNMTVTSPASVQDSYSVGSTAVSVTLEDAWGNSVTRSIAIVVQDVESPTAECLPDISVPAPADELDQAKATWGSMPVSDNTDPRGSSLRIVASHQSGDLFPIGTTAVTQTVFDASNNSMECRFMVSVSALAAASGSPADSTSTIGAGAGAGVLLLVASVLALFMYRARQRARQPADWDQVFAMIDQLKNDGEANRPREIARSAMTLLEELGKGRYHWLYRSKHSSLTCVGAFGIVYKGLLEEVPNPAFLVAVKSLHVTANGSDRQELLEEAAVMSQLHHPNIVSSCSLNLVCHNLIRGIHPGSVDWRGDDWKTSLYVGCCWTCSQAAKALLTLILV